MCRKEEILTNSCTTSFREKRRGFSPTYIQQWDFLFLTVYNSLQSNLLIITTEFELYHLGQKNQQGQNNYTEFHNEKKMCIFCHKKGKIKQKILDSHSHDLLGIKNNQHNFITNCKNSKNNFSLLYKELSLTKAYVLFSSRRSICALRIVNRGSKTASAFHQFIRAYYC